MGMFKNAITLFTALILCGLTIPAQARSTQDTMSRWSLHLQTGFGENCAEVLSWGGSDALLWTGQIGLRYSITPHVMVGAAIGLHDQFVTQPRQRWCFMPVVAEYHSRRCYIEGGITGGYVNTWSNSECFSVFQIGGVVGCGLIFHTGERSCIHLGLQQTLVGEKNKLYRYESENRPNIYDHYVWWADGDFQLVLAYLWHL